MRICNTINPTTAKMVMIRNLFYQKLLLAKKLIYLINVCRMFLRLKEILSRKLNIFPIRDNQQ